ncbi:MAG: hypothetical protein JSU07_01085 [Bacteroidetes bacterium]|nr:hypothetical protein [Bacteroidota bacterium]
MKKLFFLLAVTLVFKTHAQNNAELLKLEKDTLSPIDTVRFNAYSELSWNLQQANSAKSKYYALKLLNEAKNKKSKKHIAQAFNDLTVVYINTGNLKLAELYADSCLAIRLKLNNKLQLASIYNKIGIINEYQLKYSKALEYHLLALKIFEDLNIKTNIIQSIVGISAIYRGIGDNKKAISYINKALLMIGKNEMGIHLAGLYSSLASSYDNLQIADSAIFYNKKAKEIALKAKNYSGAAVLANNLGVIYSRLGKLKERLDCYNEAIKYSEIISDTVNLAFYQCNVAQSLLEMGKIDDAEKIMKKSLQISLKVKHNENILNSYKALTSLCFYKHQPDSGIYYFEKYRLIHDSIFSVQQSDALAEAQTKYEVEKKDLELLKHKSELIIQSKQNSIKTLLLISVIAISILLILFLFYRNKYYKKQHAYQIQLKDEQNKQQIMLAQEKERTRIAQDLHDNMGAYATSILAQIDSLEVSKSTEKIKELRVDAENIMGTLRETIWVLKTKTITSQQFFDFIKNYIGKQLVSNLNLNVIYHENIEKSREISPSVGLNLYRIIQEITQNIIKHSHAKNIEVYFESSEKISICIIDDGKGFNKNELRRKSGLENIEFRANEIKYLLHIESALNTGSKVMVEELL